MDSYARNMPSVGMLGLLVEQIWYVLEARVKEQLTLDVLEVQILIE